MERAAVFDLKDIQFEYQPGRPVLDGLSLSVAEGEILGLVGPNGAGKSTLLGILTGFLRKKAGSALLAGRDISALGRREIARTIAVVPQNERPMFAFTVEQVVQMGRIPHLKSALSRQTEEDVRIVQEAMDRVGLSPLARRPVSGLSGGEWQLVLLARALAQEAPVLLMDEATASLDLAHRQQVVRLAAKLAAEQGRTIVMVVHDLNLAALVCTRLAVVFQGRIALEGPADTVIDPERIAEMWSADVWVGESPESHPIVGLKR